MTIEKIARDAYDSLQVASKLNVSRLSEQELTTLYLGLGTEIYNKFLVGKPNPVDANINNTEFIIVEILRDIWKIAKSEGKQAQQREILDIAS